MRTPSVEVKAANLSGGNQQKVIVAREFGRPDMTLAIASQPTRGLDVGSIEYIHSQIVAQRDKGAAILIVSSELDEVMALSDRLLVMYRGKVVAELDPKQVSPGRRGPLHGRSEAVSDRPEAPGDSRAGRGPPEKKPAGAGRSRLFREITGVGLDWRSALLVPLLAIITALIVSAIIIAVTDIEALRMWGSDPGQAACLTFGTIRDAFVGLFQGAFGSWSAWSETLLMATPLILAGLAVAIGFRAGLFNIGVEGQMIMGGLLATIVGFSLHLPVWIHLPLALLGGLVGGAAVRRHRRPAPGQDRGA